MPKPPPFLFKDCTLILLSAGRSAHNLRELRDRLIDVPDQSLIHHFYEPLLRPSFDDPEYDNDLAIWASRALHDEVLAERLGIVDPLDFPDIEELRIHLLDVVEERLAEVPVVPTALPGMQFHFLRSQIVVFSTELRAETPSELYRCIPGLSTSSIYLHFVDGRRRNDDRLDDFSAWLHQWGEPGRRLADSLAGVEFHHGSLAELRSRITSCLISTGDPRGVA